MRTVTVVSDTPHVEAFPLEVASGGWDRDGPQRLAYRPGGPVPARQLTIFEADDSFEHMWSGIKPTRDGYVARCSCGWQSDERLAKPLAQHQWQRHLAALPATANILSTVRRSGRWSHE